MLVDKEYIATLIHDFDDEFDGDEARSRARLGCVVRVVWLY
jgi:hypothetical protein